MGQSAMQKAVFYLHTVVLILACGLAYMWFVPRPASFLEVAQTILAGQTVLIRSDSPDLLHDIQLSRSIVLILAVVALATGTSLMVTRNGKQESILIAFSTVMSFILVLFALRITILFV
jgi:ABC-type Fe3+-siderophore transport system permease subunit